MHPNELEHITLEHGPERALTYVARRPLHYAIPSHAYPAVPPYEGRQQSSAEAATPGRGEHEQQSPNTGEAGQSARAHGSGHEHDDGVGPTHTTGTSRAEN